ncbi:SGNH/GDSL hydrolase family protein [Bacteroides sp. 519]|uniref:SGNH/GDSL hydrolase family protein n=1 Tax=Bacteroides sp. 519 TaxID=2302937 RepID=UPI00194022CE|nr:SGNH/GDSL hydrolase family protein [Bacteroides sp. 519]
MKRNRMIFLLCMSLLFALKVFSQDSIAVPPRPDARLTIWGGLREYRSARDTVEATVLLPDCFQEVACNRIEDEFNVLSPVLEKMRDLRMGASTDTLRILHIGDSHVRGRIFPNTTGEKLTEVFGPIKYIEMGVNGATNLTFTHPMRLQAIVEAQPDLLVVSFGTNESHNKRYNPNAHYRQMDELMTLIRKDLPEVPVIFTTPPGSYESFRRRNRRRTYSINPRTVMAVDIIRRYAHEHKMAVWDMYTILGGESRACKNWKEAGLMRPDHVHYMPDAYALQGELLFEAIINAYNTYVTL